MRPRQENRASGLALSGQDFIDGDFQTGQPAGPDDLAGTVTPDELISPFLQSEDLDRPSIRIDRPVFGDARSSVLIELLTPVRPAGLGGKDLDDQVRYPAELLTEAVSVFPSDEEISGSRILPGHRRTGRGAT